MMEVTAEMYKSILDALNVGVALIDRNNKIIVMNRLFGEMVHENPEDRVGTSVFSCHPLESEAAVRQLIDDLKTGVKKHFETWLNFKGRILYEHIYPIWNDQGNYVGMLDLLYDAADKADHMRRLGEWEDLPVKGLRKRASSD